MTEPETTLIPDCRIIGCDNCQEEGRIIRGQYDQERDCGECQVCKGTGREIIEVEPITEDDLDHLPAARSTADPSL